MISNQLHHFFQSLLGLVTECLLVPIQTVKNNCVALLSSSDKPM